MKLAAIGLVDVYEPFVYLLIRVVLGALFFFQAYDKVVRIKLKNEFEEVRIGTKEKGIPDWFAQLSVYATSYLELIGGVLIAVGLFTVPVMYAFAVHLMIISIGFGYLKGLWDLKHVFPRLILLIILFLIPLGWNVLSLDYLIFSE